MKAENVKQTVVHLVDQIAVAILVNANQLVNRIPVLHAIQAVNPHVDVQLLAN